MSETDRQLKDKLNSNQVMRERMCLELLQTEEKFSNVRPRLPKGGRDGGRDIEADYGDLRVFGAVGFFNDAADGEEYRRKARKKFNSDLASLKDAAPDERNRNPKVFCFFTNIALTPKIIDGYKKSAYEDGVEVCEIFDRERLRLLLDRNTGYAIRFRYLDIPLTDAEQKDFFSAWGDELQEMVTSNLTELGAATQRLNFLAEAQFLVDRFAFSFALDQSLGEISGGNFVIQCTMILRSHVDGLVGFVFGAGNKPIDDDQNRNSQYGYGYAQILPGSRQYEQYEEMYGSKTVADDAEHYVPANSSSGILEVDRSALFADYGGTPFIARFYPTCKLIDLNRALIIFQCNEEIAGHIDEIVLRADQYEVLRLGRTDFNVAECKFENFRLPAVAHQVATSHEWCKISPANGTTFFSPEFVAETPKRFVPIET